MRSAAQELVSRFGSRIKGAYRNAHSIELLETSIGQQLLGLLNENNGIFLFNRAIILFPVDSIGGVCSLEEWNALEGWKSKYETDKNLVFFGEDVFSNQFCTNGETIFLFDCETGGHEFFANDLNEWAAKVVSDFEVISGCSFLTEWEALNGRLDDDKRLVAVHPFVLGGKYSLDNLIAMERNRAMLFHASIARQIENLPDGAEVEISLE